MLSKRNAKGRLLIGTKRELTHGTALYAVVQVNQVLRESSFPHRAPILQKRATTHAPFRHVGFRTSASKERVCTGSAKFFLQLRATRLEGRQPLLLHPLCSLPLNTFLCPSWAS
jgi:hypothetical protein